jgi:hypothetical protein
MAKDIMAMLQAPFVPEDIEWRVQSSGYDKNGKAWAMVIPFVTNRAIQNRLDEVFGFDGWSNEYRPVTTERGLSFLCGISISTGSHTTDGFPIKITKWDGADETDIENFKGGLSNAMKRSAVQFGIGRYLYKLQSYFADLTEGRGGDYTVKITNKEKTQSGLFSYNSPELPEWALPEGYKKPKKGAQVITDSAPAKDAHEKIIEKIGARNFTAEALECKTIEQLGDWWNNKLTKDERKNLGALKDDRKKEILEETSVVAKDIAVTQIVDDKTFAQENIPDFEKMKVMVMRELYLVADQVGIKSAVYNKMKKSELINHLLKIKTGK